MCVQAAGQGSAVTASDDVLREAMLTDSVHSEEYLLELYLLGLFGSALIELNRYRGDAGAFGAVLRGSAPLPEQ